jgi:hypothetical protein
VGEKLKFNKHEAGMLDIQAGRVARATLYQAAAQNAHLQQQIAMLAFAVRDLYTEYDPEHRVPVWIAVPTVPEEDHGTELTVKTEKDGSLRITFVKPEPKPDLTLPPSGLVGPNGAPVTSETETPGGKDETETQGGQE